MVVIQNKATKKYVSELKYDVEAKGKTKMTYEERLEKAIAHCDLSKGDIDALIAYAFYRGKCYGVRRVCDVAADVFEKQHKRAKECRYSKMAEKVVGTQKYIYDSDYDNWIMEWAKDKCNL